MSSRHDSLINNQNDIINPDRRRRRKRENISIPFAFARFTDNHLALKCFSSGIRYLLCGSGRVRPQKSIVDVELNREIRFAFFIRGFFERKWKFFRWCRKSACADLGFFKFDRATMFWNPIGNSFVRWKLDQKVRTTINLIIQEKNSSVSEYLMQLYHKTNWIYQPFNTWFYFLNF